VLEKRLGKEIPADAEESAKVALAKKQANVALALLRMGQYDRFRQVLRQSPDPTVRSYLIHQLAPSRIDPKLLFGHLESESDVSVRIALVLALGEFDMDQLPSDERQPWLAELLQMYRADINSGLHGAVEWVLGRWNQQDKLKEIDNELKTGKIEGARQWFLNREGQSFVIVPRPGQFWMGEGKERHQEEIRRTFAIASKEATLEQFLRFCKARKKEPKKYESFVRSGDCPVNSVTWYEAAEYCNWLSEREGIPQEQWCYLPNEEGFYAKGMKLAPQCLQRTGYRLPTDMEWEFSCRSGTATRFSFGATEELAAKYAWHSLNSNNRSHRIARLKPNELGLFDMHGNAWEWCQAKDKESQPLPLLITDDDRQVLRGGSFNHPVVSVRSADRNFLEPWRFPGNAGFRLAKTVP